MRKPPSTAGTRPGAAEPDAAACAEADAAGVVASSPESPRVSAMPTPMATPTKVAATTTMATTSFRFDFFAGVAVAAGGASETVVAGWCGESMSVGPTELGGFSPLEGTADGGIPPLIGMP